jgi:hypothetical protein
MHRGKRPSAVGPSAVLFHLGVGLLRADAHRLLCLRGELRLLVGPGRPRAGTERSRSGECGRDLHDFDKRGFPGG